jgi:cystathionine gamma-synthase
MTQPTQPGPSTSSVHGGKQRKPGEQNVVEPIVHTVTYAFDDTEAMLDFAQEKKLTGESERMDYGRYDNPTRRAAERRLAALESAEGNPYDEIDAILTASGMAAITGLLLYLLKAGDHLIITESCYSGTHSFCTQFLPRFGIETTPVPGTDLAAYAQAIRPTTRLILAESPSNPFNRCLDLAGLAQLAQEHGLLTAVDNTFATPFNSRPLELGINFVIHSVTKYLAGHNDLMAGVIVGSAWDLAGLRGIQHELGMVVDPTTCYNIMRGVKTFGLRMARHNANAQAVAEFLDDHPAVERVWYAGLPSHPDHGLAKTQMGGFGGVVSFELADHASAARFVDALTLPTIGGSLGGVESLVHQPWILSYYETPPAERARLGIRDGLIRLAVGIEDTQDLVADLTQALG